MGSSHQNEKQIINQELFINLASQNKNIFMQEEKSILTRIKEYIINKIRLYQY